MKEADETEYWLKKLCNGNFITERQYSSMHDDNEEIVKILTSIIKTMKQRM
jgi:four helix bundle protein